MGDVTNVEECRDPLEGQKLNLCLCLTSLLTWDLLLVGIQAILAHQTALVSLSLLVFSFPRFTGTFVINK